MQITRVSLEKNKNLKAKMNISVEELEDNFKEISQKVEQKDQEMEKEKRFANQRVRRRLNIQIKEILERQNRENINEIAKKTFPEFKKKKSL